MRAETKSRMLPPDLTSREFAVSNVATLQRAQIRHSGNAPDSRRRYDLLNSLRTDLVSSKIPKFSGGASPHIPKFVPLFCAEIPTNVLCPCCVLLKLLCKTDRTCPVELCDFVVPPDCALCGHFLAEHTVTDLA